MICDYKSFIEALLDAGFSGAVGGKDDGVFGLFRYGWGAEDETGIEWHTENAETDPWQWRMRVLNERNDIAYAKIFFKKAGYITKEWYPYFLAARRGNKNFEDDYADGIISNAAKRIYETIAENNILPLHEIKRLAGFHREDKSKFDGALNDLQMRMYLTIHSIKQQTSSKGTEYGWSVTNFCTTEHFWGDDVFDFAAKIKSEEAIQKITQQIYRLNPAAEEKKIKKFIRG